MKAVRLWLALGVLAVGCGDGGAEPAAPAPPANRAPVALVASPPPDTAEVGDTVALDLAAAFSDPDGDALAYRASSSDTAVVRVLSLEGSTVTAAAAGAGEAVLTYTATDPGELSASVAVRVVVLAPDKGILAALYAATNGPEWKRSDNWLTDAPLGDWYGVGWDGKGRVNRLLLSDNGLTGAIPGELGDLSELTHLLLRENALTGPLPLELANLSNLRNLDIRDTGLCIPSDPSFRIWLDSVPVHEGGYGCDADRGDRAALAALYAATNGLEWKQSDNWLTDAPLDAWYGTSWNGKGRVTALHLSENGLTGSIPSELGGLENLEVLDFRWNELTGPIPPELGGMASLQTLNLQWNGLTGSIPPELGDLDSLRYLNLGSNELIGPIPSELANLERLETLNLRYAGITSELCIPADPELVSWMDGIVVVKGVPPDVPQQDNFFPCGLDSWYAPMAADGPSVRVVYAIPSDREFSQRYSDGIRRGLELLQWWIGDQLDGPTFAIHGDPEPCRMSEPESFYIEDAWTRVFNGVQHCAPVGYAGDEFIWIVYADVWDYAPLEVVLQATPEDCLGGRLGAGMRGIAMFGGWDLYGLSTSRFLQCGSITGIDRWIGGLGHELGHAFGLPHPSDCDAELLSCPFWVLMSGGYADWPHTFLLDEEKAALLASPFIR